jgi:hypothetical protein
MHLAHMVAAGLRANVIFIFGIAQGFFLFTKIE